MKGTIKVAAVQMEARRFQAPREYFDGMGQILDQAGEVDLVVFPANTGLFLLEAMTGAALDASMAPLVDSHAGDLLGTFEEGWGALTKARGIYVAAGTLPLVKEGRRFHSAMLFGPDGRVVGVQPQTHLLPWEREVGWTAGTELQVFPTEVGLLGFLVNTDVWYPEASRILTLQGATLLLAVTAVPKPYEYWHQVRGLWQEVQQNQVFGVESGLVGSAFGREFEGRAAAFAPCEATPGETGWVASLAEPSRPGILTAELSYSRLQETIDRYSIFDELNYALYNQFLPNLYLLAAQSEERR